METGKALQHRKSSDLEKNIPTMNFQKLFIFTLAVVALSGFSTLAKGVNAASIEDRAIPKPNPGSSDVEDYVSFSHKL